MITPILMSVALANFKHLEGTVAYREKIALPTEATLTIALDEFAGSDRTSWVEQTIRLNGRQVPISFRLPYDSDLVNKQSKYGLRFEIRSGDNLLLESREAVMVINNGKNKVDVTLVKAAMTQPQVEDVTWELFAINGRTLEGPNKRPTIHLYKDKGGVGGTTGVNTYGGDYKLTGSDIQIDFGFQTLMAGSEEQMALESEFRDTLGKVTKVTVRDGEMILSRGDKELARFRKASSQQANR